MTNTIKHVKDDAEYVKIKDSKIKNVQQFFDSVGEWSFKSNGLPVATTTNFGISKIATQKEVDDGITDNIVTPKTLAVRLQKPSSTEDVAGITRYTKNSEALSYGNTTSATPKTVKYIFDNNKATESSYGISKKSTIQQAIAGKDDDSFITPLKLSKAVNEFVNIPTYDICTESTLGLTRLATIAQVRAGVIREGYSISPYTFANLHGNESQIGVYRVAKQNEVNDGNLDNVVVTPKKLKYFFNNNKSTDNSFGVTKLTTDLNSNDANVALSPRARVMGVSGGSFSGRIYDRSVSENNKYITKSEIVSLFGELLPPEKMEVPVATIIMRYSYRDIGEWMVCDGRELLKSEYPELFSIIGNSVGTSHFKLPDMRNIFPRGASTTRPVGKAEKDQIRRHKHVMSWGEATLNSSWGKAEFGATNTRWKAGAGRSDSDNYWYHTNDGSDYDGVVNPAGVIGDETRPANIAVAFLIKVR